MSPSSYNYATFSLYGVVLARLEQIHEARIKLNEGLAAANALLERTGRLFAPKYMRGLCFATLAVLSSQPEQDEFLWKAQRAYDEALENCNAEGVRHDARLLLREVSKMNEPLISEIMKLLI